VDAVAHGRLRHRQRDAVFAVHLHLRLDQVEPERRVGGHHDVVGLHHAFHGHDLAPGCIHVEHGRLLVQANPALHQRIGHRAGEPVGIELRLAIDAEGAGGGERQRPCIGHRLKPGHCKGLHLFVQQRQLPGVGRFHCTHQRAAHQAAVDPVVLHAGRDRIHGRGAHPRHVAQHLRVPALQQRGHARRQRRVEIAGGATGVERANPAGLQQHHLQAGLLQAVRDHHPGYAGTDHRNVGPGPAAHRHRRRRWNGVGHPETGHGAGTFGLLARPPVSAKAINHA